MKWIIVASRLFGSIVLAVLAVVCETFIYPYCLIDMVFFNGEYLYTDIKYKSIAKTIKYEQYF